MVGAHEGRQSGSQIVRNGGERRGYGFFFGGGGR
jgi:hypothetical protein